MNRPGRVGRRGSVRVIGLLATLVVALLTAGCGIFSSSDASGYRDDRGDLTQLVYRFYDYSATGQFPKMDQVLTDDVAVSSPGGGETKGRDKVVASASAAFKQEGRTQHLVSNVLVDVNGDKATVQAEVVELFGSPTTPKGKLAPEATMTLNSTMHFEAARTPQGWRLSRIVGDLQFASQKPAAAGSTGQ